ncbi:MAG: T9SS type A sorting domain-containing protein [Gemmatimonadota bacterium]|nr:T9SS type A sorting domain-containing protein [Gemmatimonadota bacterium]
MRRILILSALLVCATAFAAGAATIVIVNNDGPGEGFNDPTAATPVGGNPGVTVGQQRLNAFQEAADIWGALLPSAVTIRVLAQFNPQTCTATSAVLGSAGPIQVFRDFTGAELPATWYHVALANKLAGFDLSASDDISATFNSNINGNPSCLGGRSWYYGFDGNEGTDVELLPVLLHEMGHGLGFSTLVGSSGAELSGFQDLYETFIRDNTLGDTWNNLSQPQRAASAINTGNVVWNGSFVTAHAPLELGPAPTMFVNSGGSLPPTIAVGTAAFGPALTEVGVTGNIVLVNDGTGTVTDACEPLVNGAQVSGNIALIDRGTCTFVSKAQAAQAAGAIAVIIANNVAGSQPITLGGTDPSMTIPVVSITLNDGNAIKAELVTGVNVTLALDPARLAGTDSNGRVLLYAPNPYEGGSSISHWDVSALPNLLMEPAINANLSSDVDLTLAHFTDLGWLDALPTAVDDGVPAVAMLTNYPNPFNPTTTIRYAIPSAQNITLGVFDVRGRLVRSLDAGAKGAGPHQTFWDGHDDHGRPVSSGVYYVRLAGDRETLTRKIVLLK